MLWILSLHNCFESSMGRKYIYIDMGKIYGMLLFPVAVNLSLFCQSAYTTSPFCQSFRSIQSHIYNIPMCAYTRSCVRPSDFKWPDDEIWIKYLHRRRRKLFSFHFEGKKKVYHGKVRRKFYLKKNKIKNLNRNECNIGGWSGWCIKGQTGRIAWQSAIGLSVVLSCLVAFNTVKK